MLNEAPNNNAVLNEAPNNNDVFNEAPNSNDATRVRNNVRLTAMGAQFSMAAM